MNNNPWYLSSTGSGDLSLTIKGVLIGIIPLAIFIGQQFHIELTSDGLTQGIQAVGEVASGAVVLYGAVRKVYFWAKQTFKF